MLQIALVFAFFIPLILFFRAQQRTLKIIRPENREMSPGTVWLQLIPFIGLAWQFLVVIRIARSISKETASKIGESILDDSPVQTKGPDGFPTYQIGLIYCTLITLGFIINYGILHSGRHLAMYGSIFILLGTVCWIIYWVRLVKTKNHLARL